MGVVLAVVVQVKRLLRRVAVLLADTPALRQTAQLELILHTWKHVSLGHGLLHQHTQHTATVPAHVLLGAVTAG